MQTKPAVKITNKPGMAVQTEVKGGYQRKPGMTMQTAYSDQNDQ